MNCIDQTRNSFVNCGNILSRDYIFT